MTPVLELLKTCTKCRLDKVPDDFYRHPHAPDGRQPICKECKKAYERERRALNPAALAAYNRQYYEKNTAKMIARVRDYAKTHPEWAREGYRRRVRRRRGRKLAAFVEDVDPLIVLELSDGVCGICGDDVDPLAFHVDHIIPIARGGEHSYANTQSAHPLCNVRKNDRLPE